ncbi:acyl-coenzyme A thioesterase 8, partial [Python bivittatus]|uniref:Acyl-coenzyme A thioesterase 8 n=1 Tax=Python bivittatus TaxID=176946 RepID=A0A9F5JCY6_PYTBI
DKEEVKRNGECKGYSHGNPVFPWGAHCRHFWLLGDPTVPVLYQVERTRTGRSFSVRSVKAIQHGKPIFICQASFQRAQASPVQHQFHMPAVPLPEELLTQEQLIQRYLRDPNLLERYRQGLRRMLAQEVPIEMKPVNPPDFFHKNPQEPKQLFWVRAKGYIGKTCVRPPACLSTSELVTPCSWADPREGSVNLKKQRCSFGSREVLWRTCLLPSRELFPPSPSEGQHLWTPLMSSAGVPVVAPPVGRRTPALRALCFSSPLLPPGGCRGLVHGRLWRRDGVLAASCAQEGVIRVQEQPTASKL